MVVWRELEPSCSFLLGKLTKLTINLKKASVLFGSSFLTASISELVRTVFEAVFCEAVVSTSPMISESKWIA